MKKWWWKVLGIILVAFSIIAGLAAPLSPGIIASSPEQLAYGANQLKVKGYNTHFKNAEHGLQVWLMNGTTILKPYEMAVPDNSHLRASFSIPDKLSANYFNLYVNDSIDGTMELENAFFGKGIEVIQKAPDGAQLGKLYEHVSRFTYPNRAILTETIRNLYFHVPMWFSMLVIMVISLIQSIKYLSEGKIKSDIAATQAARFGVWLGLLGLATGSVWARFTWGDWWVSDTRLNGAALTVLIYLAYFVLRGSVDEDQKAARIAAVYNIFAFALLVVFLLVIPRMTDSLHPGAGGNPGFKAYDLDNTMRLVFYPAVAGWILISLWIYSLSYRFSVVKRSFQTHEKV